MAGDDCTGCAADFVRQPDARKRDVPIRERGGVENTKVGGRVPRRKPVARRPKTPRAKHAVTARASPLPPAESLPAPVGSAGASVSNQRCPARAAYRARSLRGLLAVHSRVSDLPDHDEVEDSASEGAFHAWIRRRNPFVGDDLAVLNPPAGARLLAGVDPVLDGVHLHVREHGYAAAGRKAVRRNLSDVAGMGGMPIAVLLSLICPRSAGMADVQTLYEAAERAAGDAGCPIVGGDFATWDGPLAVTVAVLGVAEHPVPRGRARPGQSLYVTGPLGGSIRGRHLTFAPRLDEGRRLAERAGELGVTAMMDLSDGLSRDLPRLLGSNVGATIDVARVPVHHDANALSAETGREPLWHALNDGEDYELLFAADRIAPRLPAIRIGTIDPEPGVRLRTSDGVQPLDPEGWEHRLA